jgi:hypothetical protein
MTYGEWLRQQTLRRAEEALRHLRVCRLLGIASRRYPLSARTKRLRAEVQRYYGEEMEKNND